MKRFTCVQTNEYLTVCFQFILIYMCVCVCLYLILNRGLPNHWWALNSWLWKLLFIYHFRRITHIIYNNENMYFICICKQYCASHSLSQLSLCHILKLLRFYVCVYTFLLLVQREKEMFIIKMNRFTKRFVF